MLKYVATHESPTTEYRAALRFFDFQPALSKQNAFRLPSREFEDFAPLSAGFFRFGLSPP